MLSKNTIAWVRALHDTRAREQEQLFLVEGRKSVEEFLGSDFEIVAGYFLEDFSGKSSRKFPQEIITKKELERITTLKSNDFGLIIVRMKTREFFEQGRGLTLILDGINDPGNLGTIIRIADWYGISDIIASRDTVDCYNSKVIMASMGSFPRVSVFYQDLEEFFNKVHSEQNTVHRVVYGAYLEGESIRTKKFTPEGAYLVIGSESHGIRPYLERYITDKVTIPRFGLAESLNAGVATGIILERIVGE